VSGQYIIKFLIAIITSMSTEEEEKELAHERLRLEEVRNGAFRFRLARRASHENDDDDAAAVMHSIELETYTPQQRWCSRLRELLCGTRDSSRFRLASHENDDNAAAVVHAIGLQSSARQPGWSSHLRELLCGTRDADSPLHLLRGHEATILRAIYDTVTKGWAAAVKLTPPAHTTGRMRDPSRSSHQHVDSGRSRG
jgi:hypothetical protein